MDLERGGGDSDGPRAPACRCRPPAPIEQTPSKSRVGPDGDGAGPAPAFLLLVTATGRDAYRAGRRAPRRPAFSAWAGGRLKPGRRSGGPGRAEESVRPWVPRIQTSVFGGSPVENGGGSRFRGCLVGEKV